MKLLVSTHSFLLEVVLGTGFDLESITPIAGFHYGICLWSEGRVATMARKENAITVYSHSDENSVLERKEEFIPTGEYKDIHQIARQGNVVLVTNTGLNEISLIQDGKYSGGYRFGEFSSDVNHVNSVFPIGETRMLVMLHNGGRTSSEICVLERTNGAIKEIARFPTWDIGGHNIFTDGKIIAYNASDAGGFVLIDIATQSVINRSRFPGHTKGLAVTNDHYIVGYSDHTERKKRSASRGYLAFVNRESLCIDATIDLNRINGSVGNVNEVRCLTGVDLSHGLTADPDVKWEELRMSDQDLVYKFFSRHVEYFRRKTVFGRFLCGFFTYASRLWSLQMLWENVWLQNPVQQEGWYQSGLSLINALISVSAIHLSCVAK
jgi:hypothetical protein